MNESEVITRLGENGFEKLVAAFYRRVAADELLSPMYPPDEFDAARRRLTDFLIQRFGGSTKYSDERGHPRLRMRHAPFRIDRAARDAWLENMLDAMREVGIAEPAAGILRRYFAHTATFLINS